MIKAFTKKIIKPWSKKYSDDGFLRNFVSVLGIDILVKASAFILLPVFLRLMSQEEFGRYNYFLSIIQTFSLVLNFGLYIAQTRLYHAAASTEERGRLLFTLSTTLVAGVLLICIPMGILNLDYAIVNFLFNDTISYSRYRGILTLAILISLFNFMLTNFLYTSEKIRLVKAYNIFRIVGVNLVSVIALYLIIGDHVRTRLIYTYLTELLLLAFFAFYLIKEMVPRFSKNLMMKSLRIGLPMMVSAIFGIMVNFSDKFLLQKYSTSVEVDLSNYYLAFSFAGIIPLIFASLQNVWLPVFMKEKNVRKNFDKTNKLISKVLLFFIPAALTIWILFEVLLRTGIIPMKYWEVTYILPLLLVTQLFAVFAHLFSNYLVYFAKTQYISYAGLVVSAVSLGLGIWLVPRYGVYGAAITAMTGNLAYFVSYYYLAKNIILKEMAFETERLQQK